MARAFLTPSCSIGDREPIPFRDSIGNHSITPVAKPLLDLANHKNRHVSAETSAFFSVNILKYKQRLVHPAVQNIYSEKKAWIMGRHNHNVT